MFSIQMLLHFSQIVQRVCTLVFSFDTVSVLYQRCAHAPVASMLSCQKMAFRDCTKIMYHGRTRECYVIRLLAVYLRESTDKGERCLYGYCCDFLYASLICASV